GSGLSEIAGFLQNEAVDYLGVAYVDEAVELRKKGISIPIMIMNPEEIDFSLFEKYNLEAEIYCQEILDRFIESGAQACIHLKLETGMNRLGFSVSDLPRLLQTLQAHPSIPVRGIFTHFSSSDASQEDAFTHTQAGTFQKMAKEINTLLSNKPILHAVNSSGIVRFPEYHFDMVRLGIGLHGFDPTGELTLEPVSQLKTSISQIKKLSKGESVGYSRKGQLHQDSEIAILPIGYADGYLRVFGNGAGKVKIGDRFAPTIGNICMDMTMIDVTGLNAESGDEVIVFGTSPTIQDLATWAGTIPYEILTNVSERVKRVYVSE
ncbi:MAG: alanine racemase, partial [Cyclobacteriaceae bacterium]